MHVGNQISPLMMSHLTLDDISRSNSRSTGALCNQGRQGQLYPSTEGALVLLIFDNHL